jgi:ferredoxin-NADP reductase
MQLVFKKSQSEADASSFIFEPTEPLTWQAGQSIKIEVPGPYGPLEHRFSIASAPYEQDIMITTRLSGSPYKNSLAALKAGDIVDAHGLEGDFIWREGNVPHVFVAAGIGITPYRAMLLQRVYVGKPLHATLLYGSSKNEFLFKAELDQLAASHPELTISFIDRRLNADDIPANGLVYLSGPSAMVDELSAGLQARGMPKTRIIHDWFTGRFASDDA